MKTGVIVTDIQGDFTELKHGFLAVKGTDQRFIDTVQTGTKMLKEKVLINAPTHRCGPMDRRIGVIRRDQNIFCSFTSLKNF